MRDPPASAHSGVGVGTVRQLLGHHNLQTTQRYAESTQSDQLENKGNRRRGDAAAITAFYPV